NIYIHLYKIINAKIMNPKIIGIIPARLKSSRLEEKLLYKIFQKPLVQHTFENAKKAKILDDLFIATDSERISNLAKKFGAKCIMSSKICDNGTARIIDAIYQKPEINDCDIIVNIQADHPKIHPNTIKDIVDILKNDKNAVCSTAVTKISYELAKNENVVKCVFDKNQNALYFSRSLIPHSKDKENIDYYYHIGLYAYRVDFLKKFENLKSSKLEVLESLEQLKILENGYSIKVANVLDMPIGVDVFEDIKRVEEVLCP
ncbi:MAG: 3-deoxy-manno-octulosonate cytidylyltransferase, partial [Parachlamydiales bacterium]|nr:3-deoxy-manno-octulosonate cytidylyltransferase [Parachlamydiales bacterium]